MLPLSGGADSSATAAIVGCMCQLITKAINAGDTLVEADAKRYLDNTHMLAQGKACMTVCARCNKLAARQERKSKLERQCLLLVVDVWG